MEDIGRLAPRNDLRRDWTKGNILRNVLSLSWPIIVSNSLNMVGPTIDMIWVGRLGATSIAAVGVAGLVTMLLHSALLGLFIGLRAIVARFVGAGDERGANDVAQQALIIAVATSIVLAAVGVFFAEPILSVLGVESEVVKQGAPYLRIQLVGILAMSLRFMGESLMQASGDAITPMKIAVVFRAFHVALCPFLIFGWWLFPAMGVSGAALTNIISQSLGTALLFWILLAGRSRLRLTFSNFRLDPQIIWRIVRIGLPASGMAVQRNVSQLVLMWFMVPFGTLAVAAHSLNQRIEMLLFMPAWGFGIAAGVLVGQNLGAGQPERAERSGWLAAALAEGVILVCSLAIWLWAEGIIRIFSPEPEVVELGSTFLRIATAGYAVMALTAVFQQCISGAGDTLPPMLFTTLFMFGVQVPLAWLLPRVTDLGVYGVRWAIVAGTIVGTIAYIVYFRLGKWKHKKV